MSSKSVSQIFKILFQTGDANIFASFSVYVFNFKALFLTKKTLAVKSERHKVRTWSFFIFLFYDYKVNQLC